MKLNEFKKVNYMKKLLLLSLLVLFGCSKGEESNASQTLIESLDGKLLESLDANLLGSNDPMVPRWWIDKTQQHPLTKIYSINNYQGVCYKNWFLDNNNIFNSDDKLTGFNVLINDNNTYKSETIINAVFNNTNAVFNYTVELTFGQNEKEYVLKESKIYLDQFGEIVYSTNDIGVYYLDENYPLTPSELCSSSS